MKTPVPTQTLLEALRVRLGLPFDDPGKDPEINQAFAMAVLWLEQYLDRILWETNNQVTETRTHFAGYTLSLKGYPVTSDPIAMVSASPTPEIPDYHLDHNNGLVQFDGFAKFHRVTISYQIEDILEGPLRYALLLVFDQMHKLITGTTSDSEAGGPIKSISSDGSRIEYDTSAAAASAGTIDLESSLPALAVGMLNLFRRNTC